MPALHYSSFYRPDALPATQPTASKHWRQSTSNTQLFQFSLCFCNSRFVHFCSFFSILLLLVTSLSSFLLFVYICMFLNSICQWLFFSIIIGGQLWWLFISGSLLLSNLYMYLLCSDMVNKLLSLSLWSCLPLTTVGASTNFTLIDWLIDCCLQCFDALVGRQEGHPACKKLSGEVLAWLSVWSKVQTYIWPSWCHCHSLSLASVKSRLVLPFWYRLTRIVPEKGCVCACVCVCVIDLLLLLAADERRYWRQRDRERPVELPTDGFGDDDAAQEQTQISGVSPDIALEIPRFTPRIAFPHHWWQFLLWLGASNWTGFFTKSIALLQCCLTV